MKKRIGLKKRQSLFGYAFVLPFVLGFVFLTMSPLILYVVLGFSKVTAGSNGITLTSVGWQNYIDLFFSETDFLPDMVSSISNMLMTGMFVVMFSLFIATVLNQKFRGRTIARTVFFLPIVVSSGVAAMTLNDSMISSAYMALNKMAEEVGLMDTFTKMIGVTFGEEAMAGLMSIMDSFYTIVISSGVQVLIFLAGLQTISPSLYEAARIDGATGWESYWKITFPMISPMILVNVVYTVVDLMNTSENKIIMTLYEYSAEGSNYGLSSAMGTVYFGIVLVLMALIFFIISRFVVYEEQ